MFIEILGSVLFGFFSGVLSGYYGVGGGWLVTPFLNLIIHLPMPKAIGTSLIYVVVVALFGTFKHKKLKNVSYPIGFIVGGFAIAGVILGRMVIRFLENIGTVDNVIGIVYIVFLSGIGIYMFFEGKKKKKGQIGDVIKKNGFLRFPVSIEDKKLNVSLLTTALVGVGVGFLSSVMGIGGGFILFPSLIYLIGMPVSSAVGTSLFSVLIIGVQGSIVYALSDKINYILFISLAAGSIPGISLGVEAIKRSNPDEVKSLFSITLFAGALAFIVKRIFAGNLHAIILVVTAVFITTVVLIRSFLNRTKNTSPYSSK